MTNTTPTLPLYDFFKLPNVMKIKYMLNKLNIKRGLAIIL